VDDFFVAGTAPANFRTAAGCGHGRTPELDFSFWNFVAGRQQKAGSLPYDSHTRRERSMISSLSGPRLWTGQLRVS
jgi:hypothetical protein